MAGQMRSDAGSSFLNSRRRAMRSRSCFHFVTTLNHRYRALVGRDCHPASHISTFFLILPASAPSAYSVPCSFCLHDEGDHDRRNPPRPLKWRLFALGTRAQEPSGTAPTSTAPAVEEMRPGLLHTPAINSHWTEGSSPISPSTLYYSSLFAVRYMLFDRRIPRFPRSSYHRPADPSRLQQLVRAWPKPCLLWLLLRPNYTGALAIIITLSIDIIFELHDLISCLTHSSTSIHRGSSTIPRSLVISLHDRSATSSP